LLGLKHDGYENFIVGNVHTDSFDDMLRNPVMAAMTRDIAAGVDACLRDCEYFSVCGGGAPVNKLAENDSFRSGSTAFCRLTQMVPIDLILEAVDRLNGSPQQDEVQDMVDAMRPPFVSAATEIVNEE
jgi:uncharacterized protein